MHVPVMRPAAVAAVLWLASGGPVAAQASRPDSPPASFTAISPVFGQLVAFSLPSNFVTAFEDAKPDSYTREAVPKGESVQQWSEMITLTGAKGAASAPNASAEKFAGVIAGGFQRACPDSFAARGSPMRIAGFEAFMAVVGCGRVSGTSEARSETALIVAIKGTADLYTLQWAERGAPAAKPDIENAKWQARMQRLAPIKLCTIVPGEKPPYPSCVGRS